MKKYLVSIQLYTEIEAEDKDTALRMAEERNDYKVLWKGAKILYAMVNAERTDCDIKKNEGNEENMYQSSVM